MKMTTFKIFTSQILTIACAAVLLAACSGDGQRSSPPSLSVSGDANKNAPLINTFTVQDASSADAKAGQSADIDEGGSVFLVWDVTGAKSVEISTKSTQRKLDKVTGLSGKATAEALSADETFILTAEGADGVKVQAQVSVKIRKREIKINFVAKPQEIRAGEMSDLCWTIEGVSSKAKVSIIDDEKTEIYPGNTVPDGEPSATPAADAYGTPTPPPAPASASVTVQKLLLAAAIPSAPPTDTYGKKPEAEAPKKEEVKEVCIHVSPAKTTTYTLTVADAGKSATQTTELKVNSAAAQIDIVFVAQPMQLSGAGEATLSWRVMPDDVTVTIDHDVTKDDKANGEKKVYVAETTTFTLTAKTKDGQTQTKSVIVTVGRMAGKVTAQLLTPSVFAGEPVKIAVTSDNPSAKFNVRDPRGNAAQFTQDGATLTIANPVSGNYVVEVDGVLSNPVAVDVRQLDPRDHSAANGLGLRGLGLTITGDANSKSAQVNLTSFSSTSKDTSVAYDFGKEFTKKMKGDDSTYLVNYAPYKVNAVAFSSKGRAFAGMTGGVLYSDNSGASWNVLGVLPAYDTSYKFKDKEESHPGCFGSTRKGTKSFSASVWMVNVFEVCDLVHDEGTDGKDRLLMATDFGVFYIDGVDGRIKDPTNKAHAMQGTLKKDNALFGKVVNRIVIAKAGDQKVVVAAASDGVYINTQRGDYKAWKQLDAAGLKTAGPVNAIAVAGTTIYAGTDKGLFRSSGLDATSTFTQVTISADAVAVKALAVDAADPSILYVGTDKGLKLSRNCSASFVDVAAPVGAVRNIATATEGGRSAVVLTSDKGLFSSTGVAGTSGSCVAKP